MTAAIFDRRVAEANLAQVNRLLHGATDFDTTTQVLQSPLIQRFREDELALERQEADMSENFGPKHPVMAQLRAEKKRLRDRVHEEIAKIARNLENETQIARQREEAVQKDLQAVKMEMTRSNEGAVGLRTLEHDAEANRPLIDRFLTSFMETSAQEDVRSQLPDARIISPAPVPKGPSFPNKFLLIGVAVIASTAIGLLLVFAVEHFDAGFRSAEQLEEASGLPVLAQIPLVKSRNADRSDISSYLLSHPLSVYAEAIHGLHTRLILSFSEHPAKIVVLLSTCASEGKSTTTLALARQQAQAGLRVIVVDADFRRSPIAGLANVAPWPGLSDLLSGSVAKGEAIQNDTKSLAHIIVSGRQPLDSLALGDPRNLQALLAELRQDYDLILLDAPPALALADANIIAAVADIVVLVVRWGKTPRRAVKYVIRSINRYRGVVHGAILTMVDLKKHARYGFGDSAYYYGDAKKYYSG